MSKLTFLGVASRETKGIYPIEPGNGQLPDAVHTLCSVTQVNDEQSDPFLCGDGS